MTALHEDAEEASFSVDFTIRDDVIALHGELDIASASTLDAALELVSDTAGDLMLDLTDLDHIDSIGLTCLVKVHTRLEASGGRLVLRGPTRTVRRVLTVSGLDRVFLIDP
jgi:anti-anti-sigma factor